MHKLLLCVLMMTLSLTACGGAGEGREAEEMSLAIRGEYLEMTSWSADADITADYGRRVYQYRLTASAEGEEMTLTLSAPETVAGITARIRGKNSALEYDGLSVETGPLDGDGLTPVSAIPAMLEAARTGYITACSMEADCLRVDCGDPEGQRGQGREISLWFAQDTHALIRGEVLIDGFRAISCEFSNVSTG